MKKLIPLLCLLALVVSTISCGEIEEVFDEVSGAISDTESSSDKPAGEEPGASEPDIPEPDQPPAQLPSNCDSPATPIAINTAHNLQMHSTTQPYPANCLYYCFQIPDGSDLDVGIYNFNTDLDIYIGYGSIEAVDGVEPEWGQSYDWMSNEFGTGDEVVSIPGPQAGVYYVEVCSYQGESTSFRLEVDFQ
jgi:hypothetical protein